MNELYVLRNREYKFVAAAFVLGGETYSQATANALLKSHMADENWFEDQSRTNALRILKEVAFSSRNGLDRYVNIGIVPKNAPKGVLDTNVYKRHTEGDLVIITFDEKESDKLDIKYEPDITVSESAEDPDPNY